MPNRKNVFLIGAGASAHTGAPVMGNFLQSALNLLDSGVLTDEDARRFKRIISYRNAHDAVEQKAGFDLTNLEDVFGLIEIDCRVDKSAVVLRDDLIFLILKTLEQTIKEEDPDHTVCQVNVQAASGARSQERKQSVSGHFVDIVSRRWEQRPQNGICKDSIISLNYDLILERTMAVKGMQPLYYLDPRPGQVHADEVAISLLKLHGSANWSICSNPGCETVQHLPIEAATVSGIESSKCTCGSAMKPFIVPPTWSKGEHGVALQNVWRSAFEELVTARRWVFIGSSLAPTDLFLRYLLALALQRNKDLDRIVVIDNGETGYDQMFQNYPKRMIFTRNRSSFQETVASGTLQYALGQIMATVDVGW